MTPATFLKALLVTGEPDKEAPTQLKAQVEECKVAIARIDEFLSGLLDGIAKHEESRDA